MEKLTSKARTEGQEAEDQPQPHHVVVGGRDAVAGGVEGVLPGRDVGKCCLSNKFQNNLMKNCHFFHWKK